MTLVEFWAVALSLVLYVLLDGFGLEVGILFPFPRGEAIKHNMLRAISPV